MSEACLMARFDLDPKNFPFIPEHSRAILNVSMYVPLFQRLNIIEIILQSIPSSEYRLQLELTLSRTLCCLAQVWASQPSPAKDPPIYPLVHEANSKLFAKSSLCMESPFTPKAA